jgi:hypothetical protein
MENYQKLYLNEKQQIYVLHLVETMNDLEENFKELSNKTFLSLYALKEVTEKLKKVIRDGKDQDLNSATS